MATGVDYMKDYGKRYNSADSGSMAVNTYLSARDTFKNFGRWTGDKSNYIVVNCQGVTRVENFEDYKKKIGNFKNTVLDKVKEYGIDDIDCLFKSDHLVREDTPCRIAVVVSYSSWDDKPEESGGGNGEKFFKPEFDKGLGLTTFDDLNIEDKWLTIFKTRKNDLFYGDTKDSFRIAISKKGLQDYKDKKIKICDDPPQQQSTPANGGTRLSKYKKSTKRVKSAKRRSYRRIKYRKTRHKRK